MIDGTGVYSIKAPSGNVYIGMTADSFVSRNIGHLKELRGGRHKCRGLQNAFNKYGEGNLEFTVLEIIKRNEDPEKFLQREQAWWDKFTIEGIVTYNGRPSGTGSVHHTEETRLRISASLRSKERKTLTKICLYCSAQFKVYLTRKTRKYCSRICASKSARKFDQNEAVRLYSTGLSLREVARLLGVSHISVRNAVESRT